MYSYKTKGVCSHEILFDIKNNIITDLKIVGGCRGNTLGLAIVTLLKGIKCRGNTSCPDQLAQALEIYKEQN